MTAREIPLSHPGEILLEDWLKPLGISQYALAKAIDVPARRINEIVKGIRSPFSPTRIITKCPALRDLAINGASTTNLKTFSENCSFEIILFISMLLL